MDIEIERKWLVTEDIKRKIIRGGFDLIRQGYLSPTTRIRITNNKVAIICIKIKISELTCQEYNYSIPVSEAEDILSTLNVIKKTRFNIGNEFTLDVFDDKLDGLLIVEKEFASETLACDEQIPKWLVGQDVTDDPAYRNANLGGCIFVEGLGVTSELNVLTGDEEVLDVAEFVIN
jgi:adenylate cyclase